MGWASGCYVMDGIIEGAMKHIPDNDKRRNFYVDMIRMLEDQDWDTQMDSGEADKEVYEAALAIVHPDWNEDEDEDE